MSEKIAAKTAEKNAVENTAENTAKNAAANSAAEPALPPVTLGKRTLSLPVMLSPMAGVTNMPFRILCEEYGQDGLYVAEMITARALVAKNPKAFRLTKFAKSEKFRSLQLYGVNPSVMRHAASTVADMNLADHIDLNFGCPVPKVTRRGGGSALPWKSGLLAEIIKQVVRVCEPAGIPVTAKFRLGIDDEHITFIETGHIAQEEGCSLVTLHARTTAQYYGGHSHWERIGELVASLDIPVFGNGDVWCAEDALEMKRQTGCAGVAIGRGCQGRPWLFADIRNAFAGSGKREKPTLGQVCSIIRRHAKLLIEFCDGDETSGIRELRKHTAWYLKGFPAGGETRAALMQCETLSDLDSVLDRLDPDIEFPESVGDKPRGRTRYAKKVHLPYGWLDSRQLSETEKKMLFSDDPLNDVY